MRARNSSHHTNVERRLEFRLANRKSHGPSPVILLLRKCFRPSQAKGVAYRTGHGVSISEPSNHSPAVAGLPRVDASAGGTEVVGQPGRRGRTQSQTIGATVNR